MTPDQVRKQFHKKGQTISEWSKKHGFPRNTVYQVLNGSRKGNWGRGHEIAVALGMKEAA